MIKYNYYFKIANCKLEYVNSIPSDADSIKISVYYSKMTELEKKSNGYYAYFGKRLMRGYNYYQSHSIPIDILHDDNALISIDMMHDKNDLISKVEGSDIHIVTVTRYKVTLDSKIEEDFSKVIYAGTADDKNASDFNALISIDKNTGVINSNSGYKNYEIYLLDDDYDNYIEYDTINWENSSCDKGTIITISSHLFICNKAEVKFENTVILNNEYPLNCYVEPKTLYFLDDNDAVQGLIGKKYLVNLVRVFSDFDDEDYCLYSYNGYHHFAKIKGEEESSE